MIHTRYSLFRSALSRLGCGYFFSITLFVYGAVALASEEQNDSLLHVKPRKCVALHQGQTCYQKLKILWKTPGNGEFCLFAMSKPEPLTCWNADEQSTFAYDFKTIKGERFVIRERDSDIVIAETEVVAAWVYKSKKRKSGSWRLF